MTKWPDPNEQRPHRSSARRPIPAPIRKRKKSASSSAPIPASTTVSIIKGEAVSGVSFGSNSSMPNSSVPSASTSSAAAARNESAAVVRPEATLCPDSSWCANSKDAPVKERLPTGRSSGKRYGRCSTALASALMVPEGTGRSPQTPVALRLKMQSRKQQATGQFKDKWLKSIKRSPWLFGRGIVGLLLFIFFLRRGL